MHGRALDLLNAAALAAALACAGGVGWRLARAPSPEGGGRADAVAATVVGADGVAVPVRDYRRIVSLVPELDDALAELGMLDRVAAVTGYARAHGTRRRQLRAVAGTVPSGAALEDLLAFKPDLVLAAAFSDPGRSAKLRAAGVPVLNLGQERDAAEAAEAVRKLAAACGEPEAGAAVAARFLARLARVADPRLPRLGACYVGILAGKLEGGAAGSAYAGVIEAAGFADAASAHGYRDYPDYRVEDLIAIAPDVIVTGTGMASQIAAQPGADRIVAVASGRILEVDRDLLSATGIGMLDAAEAIADAREAAVKTVAALVVLLAIGAALSLAIGPLAWAQVDHHVLELRLTRLCAGALAGAALAVAGVAMQGLFRNPLAAPSVTGVTEGAALGVQLALVAAAAAPAALLAVPLELWRPLAAFVGAAGALAILLALCRRRSDLTSMLLIGMVLSILFSSVAAYLVAVSGDRYQLGRALVAFSLGAIDAASPASVALATPLVACGIVAAWGWGRALDVALSGEREAESLGVDLRRLRGWLLAWTALLAAAAVSLGGGVGFVGLVVPNALRALIGPGHRALVVASALGGAAFVTFADVAARACHPGPGEIPLGAITGLVGAPFFLWFFRRERLAGRM